MELVIETYEVPESWACALLYGDESGMDQEECDALAQWLKEESRGGLFECIDIESGDGDFRRFHDAARFYPFACNVARYTFHVEG
jgi:hypothetical protein